MPKQRGNSGACLVVGFTAPIGVLVSSATLKSTAFRRHHSMARHEFRESSARSVVEC
jgi:hypothetical protein